MDRFYSISTLVLLLFLLSCTEPIVQELPAGKTSPVPGKPISLQSLIGIWSDGSSENASFEIKRDSIYYVDEAVAYHYVLNGDSIHIFYDDAGYRAKVSFIGDTLIFTSADHTAKLLRFAD